MPTHLACTTCDVALQQRLFDPDTFVPFSLKLMLPLIVGAVALTWLVHRVVRAHDARRSTHGHAATVAAGVVLIGVGMGGFVDGIVFHQLLQWHELISNRLPPTTLQAKSINMFWDGLFHVLCWVATAGGIVMLYRQLQRADVLAPNALLIGGPLFGWGMFNIVDGIFNHFLFRFHNLREAAANPMAWNVGYLVGGALLAIIGALLMAKALRAPTHRATNRPPVDPTGTPARAH
jgi:uncharacterized membrane protein